MNEIFKKNTPIFVDGIKRNVDIEFINNLVNRDFTYLIDNEKQRIVECLRFLMSGLEVSTALIPLELTPEEYYFNAVKGYLEDDHTVDDLDNLDDDLEVFAYCV